MTDPDQNLNICTSCCKRMETLNRTHQWRKQHQYILHALSVGPWKHKHAQAALFRLGPLSTNHMKDEGLENMYMHNPNLPSFPH